MNPTLPRLLFVSISASLVVLLARAQAPESPGIATPPPATATVAPATPDATTAAPRGRGQGRGGPPTPSSGLRLQNIQLHDPWILAEPSTKTYYLYTAGSGSPGHTGTRYFKSKDLLDWEGPFVAFTAPDEMWANPATGAWAPEVHAYKGKYYLFTTLHNAAKPIDPNSRIQRTDYPLIMRSTMIAVADSPEGPFKLLKTDSPVAPANFMVIDGTLFVDPDGKPWMVYAHEWVQKGDGTFEALPLKDDLSDAVGPPIHLFKASDAPWINEIATPNAQDTRYVTDGCEFYRTKDGHLLMFWSSYDNEGYVQTIARSKTGTLKGPWEQLAPLVRNDSGHGMPFKTFDGQLMMVTGQPFNNQRAKIYELEDMGDHLRVVKFREDLSGPPLGPNARQPARGQRGNRGNRGNRGAAPATPAPAEATAPSVP